MISLVETYQDVPNGIISCKIFDPTAEKLKWGRDIVKFNNSPKSKFYTKITYRQNNFAGV